MNDRMIEILKEVENCKNSEHIKELAEEYIKLEQMKEINYENK